MFLFNGLRRIYALERGTDGLRTRYEIVDKVYQVPRYCQELQLISPFRLIKVFFLLL